ncbi:polyketide synthase [Roseovarius mucosus]|uniref:polyketide synthase n=1 Tax=Roseovarius mucosus TaxID=215743 RepID=UPI001C606384|nr:polyketide synthase [Roseovarius mucosus]MBW4972136.1 polyketide synthase [Roseovarius mucosus]
MRPDEPIAVIGLACRFPGVDGPEELNRLLRSGQTGIRDIPPDRWALWGLSEDLSLREGFPVTRAGTLDDIAFFDRRPFRISANEAPLIDPQQRLALETSWHALEDAGFSPACLEDAPIGVFMGAGSSDYALRMAQAGISGAGNPHCANGAQNAAISGRISYCLGLTGPSLTIDTACSSGAAAVALAGDNLRLGHCDVALAGGVNALLSVEPFRALSGMSVLSAKGETRSFDATASGFVRSEGCGVLVLKRLSCALAAGDRIHAVLPGWAMGQDGRSNGLSAPSRRAQARVILQAVEAAGLKPTDIGAIEAHGSATVLGDTIEISALADVFGDRVDTKVVVGSVKATLGHLEAAAGVAGLIKAILMVRDGFMPRQPCFATPSPRIDWDEVPFEIVRDQRVWPGPRRVMGVSSFGMSGLNAHILVSNADMSLHQALPAGGRHLFLLSAASPDSLRTRTSQLLETLRAPGADLGKIALATRRRWVGLSHRSGFVAASQEEAQEALTRSLASPSPGPAAPAAEIALNIPSDRADLHRVLQQVWPRYALGLSQAAVPDPGTRSETMEDAVLALHLAGATLCLDAINPSAADGTDLPGYPFDRQRHWFDAVRPARAPRG